MGPLTHMEVKDMEATVIHAGPRAKYQFLDDHGHPLGKCREYQEILEKAASWDHLIREGEAVGPDALYRKVRPSPLAQPESA